MQQIGDQALHAAGLPAHLLYVRPPFTGAQLIVGEILQITGDNRQGRAQLMRGVGDKILAHLVIAADPGHVPGDQQFACGAVRGDADLQPDPGVGRSVQLQRLGAGLGARAEIVRERRVPHQIQQPEAVILRPANAHILPRLAIGPLDLAKAPEDDHRVRYRGRGPLKALEITGQQRIAGAIVISELLNLAAKLIHKAGPGRAPGVSAPFQPGQQFGLCKILADAKKKQAGGQRERGVAGEQADEDREQDDAQQAPEILPHKRPAPRLAG